MNKIYFAINSLKEEAVKLLKKNSLDYSRVERLGWVEWCSYKASAGEAVVIHREPAATRPHPPRPLKGNLLALWVKNANNVNNMQI